jgi:hypothetical protein
MTRESAQSVPRSLDEQRREFARRRFLAMPLAGLIAWAVVGVTGLTLPDVVQVWVLFGATGSIVYLGMFISRYTGENFLDKSRPKNAFDSLFFHAIAMAVLVYAIAIPFFLFDYSSLPLTVGVLSGLMWMPLSWIIEHWIGLFHAITRTLLVTTTWYILPDLRFVAIPLVIVLLYAVTIGILERRWRHLDRTPSAT